MNLQQTHFKKDRIVPDYTTDKSNALMLARRIEQYYHKDGHLNVSCWVECIPIINGRNRWEIRSNIKFNVKTLTL